MTQQKPLLDVQNLEDLRGVDLTWVGISGVDMPVKLLQKNGKTQTVAAVARISVGLSKKYKGTHMSRFIEQLTEWTRDNVLSLNLQEFLADTKRRLNAPSANLELKCKYFMDKKSPATDNSAPMAYQVSFEGTLDEQDQYRLILGVIVPVTTLCPCSKQISDYGAHNQRSEIRAKVVIDPDTEHRVVWIEDLVSALEKTAACPVYPLLKRLDEKWVTEHAYDNPRFVEDVIRESTLLLRDYDGIMGFDLEVEAFESIHAHNAWTAHAENYQQVH